MDPEAAAVVTPHLLVGEKLLWCGRPQYTRALGWRASAIVVVGCAALAMRSLPLDSNLAERVDTNLILVAVLVCALIAEEIVVHSYLSNTFYGVSNQRVLIMSGLRQPELAAVLIDRLNTPQLRMRRIHRQIEFRALTEQMFQPGYMPFTNPSVPPDWLGPECYRLLALENPRRVYDLIVESANKLK